MFAEGGSGGGGASWDALSFDADDLWWLVLAVALLASAVVLLGYVISIAPLLLAEIALDAALVSSVYRRLRPQDARHWASGVVRRTWIPMTMLALCLAGAGYALQRVAPEARSIGGVIRHLAN